MSDYRRWYVPGGTYFFTLVTHFRRPILCTDIGRLYLHDAIATIQSSYPFERFAIVLLPDHLHAVWTLPRGDDRYSMRWKRIKEEFTRRYLRSGGTEGTPSLSRVRQGERGIWQRRFREHLIESEIDLERCVDYLHWNPRKHGLVTRVRDWQWSSFHRFVEMGEYDIDWGGANPTQGFDGLE